MYTSLNEFQINHTIKETYIMTNSTKRYQAVIDAKHNTNSTDTQSLTIFDTNSANGICSFMYSEQGDNDASLISVEPSIESSNLLSSNTLDSLIQDKETYVKLATSQHLTSSILNELKQFKPNSTQLIRPILRDNPTTLDAITITSEGTTDEYSFVTLDFEWANINFMYSKGDGLVITCKIEFNFDTYSELHYLLTSFYRFINYMNLYTEGKH